MNIVEQARALVMERHAHLRRLSATRQPMLEHIAEVAEMVSTVTSDPEIIAAAWLHDTVEDTNTTLDEIRTLFGERVAAIVDGLTDPPHFIAMPILERKAVQAERILSKNNDIRLVKICDQISNILSVTNDTPLDWNTTQQWTYIEGAAKIARLCTGQSEELDQQFEKAYLYAYNHYRDKA